MNESSVPLLIGMAATSAVGVLTAIAWLRGTPWRWQRRGVERWLTLYANGDLPVLIRNLPFAMTPTSLAIGSWCAGLSLAAVDLRGAGSILLFALGFAMGGVGT
jgi:hypothetical protein